MGKILEDKKSEDFFDFSFFPLYSFDPLYPCFVLCVAPREDTGEAQSNEVY